MSLYHQYGVNVKVYHLKEVEGEEILNEDDLNFAWESATRSFWDSLSDYTKYTFDRECYSEGRSGGWAIFDTGDYAPPEKWIKAVYDYVAWAKEEVYPGIVKDLIEDRRYETHFVAVSNDESFAFVDSDLKFVKVVTDKLENLNFILQIDEKITSGDTTFILDGLDVEQLASIKSR
jgi:hypothetical protein